MPGRQISEKYAGDEERIRVLCASDPAFGELWSDYCEIVNLLEASTNHTKELLTLSRELEVEIDEALE